MLKVLRFVPEVGVPRPVAGGAAVRRLLCGALLRAARQAVRLAARLEAAQVPAARHAARVGRALPQAPVPALGVRLVEAVVVLAVAAYFVAGLVGVLVA